MEIKYHAQFLLDKEKDSLTAKVRLRIKWNGKVVAFNLGNRVDIAKWSIETQRCKTNTTHGEKKVAASVINRNIQNFAKVCEKIFDFHSKRLEKIFVILRVILNDFPSEEKC